MMGLALGVDYSLLMVSRFREELAAGASPIDAAWATRRTAGRTTMFAGSTLLISMIVALFIVPGSLLASLAGTVAMVVVAQRPRRDGPRTGAAGADRPEHRSLADRPGAERESRLMGFVDAALRRPAPVAALIGAVVLLLAAPALALKTGPPSPEQLSKSDPARRDAELIDHAIGPGWDAPFQIIATTDNGPITEPGRLAALGRWQRRIAALPGVQAVIGPGQIARRVAPLREAGSALLASEGRSGPFGRLGRARPQAGVAAGGVSQLREGLSQASAGAGLLAQGSGKASAGALAISRGLAVAAAGSQRAVSALNAFAKGTRHLAAAQQKATLGALQLKLSLRDEVPNLRANALRRARRTEKSLEGDAHDKLPELIAPAKVAEEQLKAAVQQLQEMTVGRSDPHYGPALEAVSKASAAVGGTDPISGQPYAPGYAGLPTELTELQKRLVARLRRNQGSRLLAGKHDQPSEAVFGGRRPSSTKAWSRSNRAATSSPSARRASRMPPRLSTVASRASLTGATALAAGVSRIGGGATALEENLAKRLPRSRPPAVRPEPRRRQGDRRPAHDPAPHRQDPPRHAGAVQLRLLRPLGARRGARAGTRRPPADDRIHHGGQAATMLVISRYSFNTPGSIALNHRLDSTTPPALGARSRRHRGGRRRRSAQRLQPRHPVAHPAGRDRRSPSPPSWSWCWSCGRCRWPRSRSRSTWRRSASPSASSRSSSTCPQAGRWAAIPTSTRSGPTVIFGVVFGLSIDYAVFLLIRMQERYDRDGDHRAAISVGLEKTARVITGAAAIMMAVFIAFAGAPIATVSQLGIGLTVAVLLDATVVRIVLLPALMLLIGERVWWLPRPLDRVLPRLNV